MVQEEIAALEPEPWVPPSTPIAIGGCFVCFPRDVSGPGATNEPGWAAAALSSSRELIAETVIEGVSGAPYEAGLLALREGTLLEAAVRKLPSNPNVLLVNATGRDHPRGCGLALHLGAVLGLPTVGVTHRPLIATGEWPPDESGAVAPLRIEDRVVGYWLRTRTDSRPLAVHAGWRTSPEVAVEVVHRSMLQSRTPEPIRRARELARLARHAATALDRA
jgi:deoxyribonuclease V